MIIFLNQGRDKFCLAPWNGSFIIGTYITTQEALFQRLVYVSCGSPRAASGPVSRKVDAVETIMITIRMKT